MFCDTGCNHVSHIGQVHPDTSDTSVGGDHLSVVTCVVEYWGKLVCSMYMMSSSHARFRLGINYHRYEAKLQGFSIKQTRTKNTNLKSVSVKII